MIEVRATNDRRTILGRATKHLAVALVAAAALPSAARAVSLTATDAAGQTSFNSGLHWSDGLAPSAASDYTVGTGLSLRTPFDTATDITFAGNSLTFSGTASSNTFALVIKNLTNTTTTVNNLTLDFGQVQNGGSSTGAGTSVTLASNNITLGTNGGTFNAGTVGRILTVTAPITGAGSLTLATNTGLLALTGTNTYTGNTIISGGAITTGGVPVGVVQANDGAQLNAAGNLALNGGILEGSVSLSRTLGTGAGQIALAGTATGFSARGADITVSLGGAGTPTALTWGTAPFNPGILVLNSTTATNAITFANAVDMGASTRSVFVGANTATMSGAIAGTNTLFGFGAGTLILSNANNPMTGAVIIAGSANSATQSVSGTIRATASGALGSGIVTIGNGGNATLGRLELAGSTVQANPISLFSRATAGSVAIESVSGTNELSGTTNITSGGNVNIIQSDAGSTLTLSGASVVAAGIALQSAGGARTATLQGAGNGVISGTVRDSNAVAGATIAVTKAGTGTWTLSGTNSYTGTTTVSNGTLAVGSIASIAPASVVTVGGGATTAVYKLGFAPAAGAAVMALPTIAANGKFDVGTGRAVLTGTSVTAVQALVNAGIAGGSGIFTSSADAAHNVGYGDVGAGGVSVRYTLLGDANLDGSVDFNDFLVLQNNFNQPGVFSQGDFNYSGSVDFNDFLVLQNNFNQSVTGVPVTVTRQQVAALTAFAEANAVPEPATLAVVGLGALLLGRRRRA